METFLHEGKRAQELSLKNFELSPNFIKFEENLCKSCHGRLTDLKHVPNRIKHICRNVGEKHNLCLLKVYRMYIGLVECKAKESDCFDLRAAKHKFSFEKRPVRINTLNAILPYRAQDGLLNIKLTSMPPRGNLCGICCC